jgi:hypothetical protein
MNCEFGVIKLHARHPDLAEGHQDRPIQRCRRLSLQGWRVGNIVFPVKRPALKGFGWSINRRSRSPIASLARQVRGQQFQSASQLVIAKGRKRFPYLVLIRPFRLGACRTGVSFAQRTRSAMTATLIHHPNHDGKYAH